MRKYYFKIFCLIAVLIYTSQISAQTQLKSQVVTWFNDSTVEKHPWKAAATVFGANMAVWSFDRFVEKTPWSDINLKSIRVNYHHGFAWDNDMFLTNQFMHPYHGSLYYNAARANGLNYWQSIPYTIGGSLMWEMCMEKEPPSINDLFSTSIGGLFGEVTNRISSAIVDESARGLPRVGMEVAGFFLAPTKSITRMINGDMFHSRPRKYYRAYKPFPLHFQGGVGASFNADQTHLFKGKFSNIIDVQVQYNDPFEIEDCKPFDYFQLNATFKQFSNQPRLSRLSAMGLLWGKNFRPYKNHKMLYGIFQHFDYYNSDSLFNTSDKVPYKISSSAAFGAGLLYNFQNDLKTISMDMGIHFNAILMGANLTDHYVVNERDYNMGSGFGNKVYSQIKFSNVGTFYLGLNFLQLYTWDGKSPNEKLRPNYDTYNSQGDNGFTNLLIINPRMEFYINKYLSFNLEEMSLIRHSNYDFYPNVSYHTFEINSSLVYKH
ncbi:MAG: DUF3943 domain-containing protein [Bacteroidota bacterium]|nr:DUF3943 domain-containing protein [Bacteroidota bacterium]